MVEVVNEKVEKDGFLYDDIRCSFEYKSFVDSKEEI